MENQIFARDIIKGYVKSRFYYPCFIDQNWDPYPISGKAGKCKLCVQKEEMR